MKKILTSLFILFGLPLLLVAKDISKSDIKIVAKQWLDNNQYLYTNFISKINSDNDLIPIYNFKSDFVIAYLIQLHPKGFLVISKNDNIEPIVAFSFESDYRFDGSTNNFLFNYIRSELKIQLTSISKGTINSDLILKNKKKWTELLKKKIKKENQYENNLSIIGPLLNSDWGQGNVFGEPLFNIYTPHNWPAGCVATTQAQVLNYYKWPIYGTGQHSYFDPNSGNHSVNFAETVYDWANTKDRYFDSINSQAESNAAGLLTYHSAVSLDMTFAYNGSTAETADVPNAMKNYFNMQSYYSSISKSNFWPDLKENILNHKPAILSIRADNGAGHAAVVDGISTNNEYYHLNPGWYTEFNGWYNIKGTWNMAGYTTVAGATMGIYALPQICKVNFIDSLTFNIMWTNSLKQTYDYYEIQESKSIVGPWISLSSNISDTLIMVKVEELGPYYFRLRGNNSGNWTNFTVPKKIKVGVDPNVKFQVDLSYRPLLIDESIGIRGNISPLSGIKNLGPFIKLDSNNTYTYTIQFSNEDIGKTLIFRYSIDKGGEYEIESKNREYIITSDSLQILPIVYFNDITTSIIKNKSLNNDITLYQNYPNPFNSQTSIEFNLTNSSYVNLTLFNMMGQRIEKLINNKYLGKGIHRVNIDADKLLLSSGTYLIKLTSNNSSNVKKIIYLK